MWALQTGLLRRAVEVVVPVEMISELFTPPAPKVEPRPVPPETVAQPVKKAVRAPAPAPLPAAIPDSRPAPNAATGTSQPVPAPAPVAAAPAEPAPAAPARYEPPSSQADYLNNPKPAYPPLSKRLGEQGVVMVRVYIGADGVPQKAEVAKSSGFDRLDQAGINTVMTWRFVPGKRGGVAEAGWWQVPINFVLE
nr:energy transducer TonB [Caenimonas aquaedulcis]